MSSDFMITQRDDAFAPQELILLVVVDPDKKPSRLRLIFLSVRSDTSRTGESRRKVYGNITGNSILREILADYIHARFTAHFLTKVRFVVGVHTWISASYRVENLFGFEEMCIVGLRIIPL